MKTLRGLSRPFRSLRGEERVLLGITALFLGLSFVISGRKPFNFDEFQVLYASAALLRGKAYFADQLGSHFPLFNMVIRVLVGLTGFKTFALLAARYLVFLAGAATCLYVYRIGSRLWSRTAGLLAVAVLLSAVVFVEKGLEIRHDVFNTLFTVMAAYYGMVFLEEKKRSQIVLCGLLLGMAFASTQKAVVGAVGIASGLTISQLAQGDARDAGKTLLTLAGLIPIPLIASLLGLLAMGDESLSQFVRQAVLGRLSYLNPAGKDLFPFPHDRLHVWLELVKPNPLFYAAGVGGLAMLIVRRWAPPRGSLVLFAWCVLGLLFYLTMRRPFFQSFLPTVPPLALAASGLLTAGHQRLARSPVTLRTGILLLLAGGLFVWPLPSLVSKARPVDQLDRQLYNTSFCLDNLERHEKVLCFTQNQIFFDPLLPIKNSECGERFFAYEPACFEQKMIEEQCRVIINDYRTRLLNRAIREKIRSHYVALKKGHILIPGFSLKPGEVLRKQVWIEGAYYSPTLALAVDGQTIRRQLFWLTQGTHTFANLRDRPLGLVHVFKAKRVLKRPRGAKTLQGPE